MPKVPQLRKTKPITKDGLKILQLQLQKLNTDIKHLQQERLRISHAIRDARQAEKERRKSKNQHGLYGSVPVKLYALRLEDECWYIGMSFNVEKRFVQHQEGKGSVWTKLHPPLEIVEVRPTEHYNQEDGKAAKLEDEMTLEYMQLYGRDKVRGGGYCQSKPRWPSTTCLGAEAALRIMGEQW